MLRKEKMRTRMKVGTREQGQVALQSHTGTLSLRPGRARPSQTVAPYFERANPISVTVTLC